MKVKRDADRGISIQTVSLKRNENVWEKQCQETIEPPAEVPYAADCTAAEMQCW